MILIREAEEDDVTGIREVFRACYGESYAYPLFYDLKGLKKMVFDDDTLLLVAEDEETKEILGTSSVIIDIGAHGDLMGEFGRLAVHPDGRNRGIGKLLMEGRLERIEDRLHIAVIENRVVHPFSQRISARYGFTAAGFLPMKLKFDERESIALYVRHFAGCLEMRKNHPRVIAEAYPIAEHVLSDCGLPHDAIADDDTPAYPHDDDYALKELSTEGYASLLHLERGRIRHREIFGPVRLHTGLFRIRVSHANYLLACEEGNVIGGVGFTVDEIERAVQIFELVSVDSRPIHFLLAALEKKCREDGDVDYIEVDVNAHSPAMQRTLLELGFLPVGYIPAMVFHRVERLDAVRMARLLVPLDVEDIALHTTTGPVANLVLRAFAGREALPVLMEASNRAQLFEGLAEEQVRSLAAVASQKVYQAGEVIFNEGEPAESVFLVAEGRIDVIQGAQRKQVGSVNPGETLGEISLLQEDKSPHHTAGAVASCRTKLIALPFPGLTPLLRRRTDIAAMLYRNLASHLGNKLVRADTSIAGGDRGTSPGDS